ncbi:TPA: hypothetical protein ACJST2_002156, partial [Streptococcus agalactiae]
MKTVCHFYHFLSFFVVLGGGLIDFYIHFVNERFEMIELKKPTTELIFVVSVCRLNCFVHFKF